MTPPTDLLGAVPEAAPSLLWATIRMVLMVVALCAGAWALKRWQSRGRRAGRSLEILDRAFLARGTSVAVLRVENRRLLLGIAPEGVRLLRELDEEIPEPKGEARFEQVLQSVTDREGAGS